MICPRIWNQGKALGGAAAPPYQLRPPVFGIKSVVGVMGKWLGWNWLRIVWAAGFR